MRSQKQTIWEIVRRAKTHMTAEEIYLEARKEQSAVAMGTVYRNLALLTEEGSIRRLEFPGAPTRYDKNVHAHEHMVCRCCGGVEDVALCGDLLECLREMSGAELEGYTLTLTGVCTACRAQRDKAV